MASQDPSFDTWLDTQLRAVPLPPGMLARLRQIPLAGDKQLDAAVRDVPVPVGLQRRLERIGRSRLRWARLGQMALAASLVAAVGISYLGAMLLFLLTVYRPLTAPLPRLASRVTVEAGSESARRRPGVEAIEVVSREEPLPSRRVPAPEPSQPRFELAAYAEPIYSPIGETRALFAGLFNPSGWDPLEDRALAGLFVFGAPSRHGELPELRRVPGLQRRGVAIPPVDGVDVAFLIQTRFNPFIWPAADPKLQTSVVPLDVDGRSYDLTRQMVQRGKLLPPGALRTEDFLAAIDYQFPPPENGALGLHVAGGPSPFAMGDWQGSLADRQLLQIGVRARDLPDDDRPGTHLTLAVDVSASMGQDGRLEMVRRVLHEPGKWMGAKDRMSLVAFSEDAYVLAENLGRDATDRLRDAVDSLAEQGSTNVVVGLRHAYAVAYHRLRDSRLTNRIVLLTDSLAPLDPITVDQLVEQLAAPVASGISLHVIDLGRVPGEASVNSSLVDLALAGDGRLAQATGSDQVRWALRELVTGRSQLAACDVRLRVTFSPRSVIAYRLLGHEVGDVPADPEADFYAGQSATALYEVLVLRNGERDVAEAELTWRDPATGEPGSASRRVHKGQFAHYMIDAPASLQAAAVVAGAVEVLRGSPFLLPGANPRPLAPLLEQARQVDARVRQHPTFEEFIRLMEWAEAAGRHRSGGRG